MHASSSLVARVPVGFQHPGAAIRWPSEEQVGSHGLLSDTAVIRSAELAVEDGPESEGKIHIYIYIERERYVCIYIYI